MFSRLPGFKDVTESVIVNCFQYEQAEVPHRVLKDKAIVENVIVDRDKDESNEECNGEIEGRITHTKAATHFEKGMMCFLQQLDENNTDEMLLKRLRKFAYNV